MSVKSTVSDPRSRSAGTSPAAKARVRMPAARTAHEALDDVTLAQDPAQLGENLHVHADGQALAVDPHAVAVEDDQLDGAGRAGIIGVPPGHAPPGSRLHITGVMRT